jgi:hypothetical protein
MMIDMMGRTLWAVARRDNIRFVPTSSRDESAHVADSGLNELQMITSQRDRPLRRCVLAAATEQA